MNNVNKHDSIISTNTVFHFTRSIDYLESILINDFYPRFSVENFIGTVLNIEDAEKAIPMVCFCDIPLAQIKKHTEKYGDYAIGLSKEWAMSKKVNPVLYTYPGADFSDKLREALLTSFEHEENGETNVTKELQFAIQYIKPYEGKLWHRGKLSKKNVRFYDEREWRYIPSSSQLPEPLWLNKQHCQPSKIEGLNKKISEKKKLRLSFVPNDIKFIIVKNEKEVLSMLDKIIKIKRNKFSYEDVQILTTRIISMESIRENF
jgi:hypothetical protein